MEICTNTTPSLPLCVRGVTDGDVWAKRREEEKLGEGWLAGHGSGLLIKWARTVTKLKFTERKDDPREREREKKGEIKRERAGKRLKKKQQRQKRERRKIPMRILADLYLEPYEIRRKRMRAYNGIEKDRENEGLDSAGENIEEKKQMAGTKRRIPY